MRDRDLVADRRPYQPVTGQVERDTLSEAEHIAAVAKQMVDALVVKGFSEEAAVFLCGQVLDKMI